MTPSRLRACSRSALQYFLLTCYPCFFRFVLTPCLFGDLEGRFAGAVHLAPLVQGVGLTMNPNPTCTLRIDEARVLPMSASGIIHLAV